MSMSNRWMETDRRIARRCRTINHRRTSRLARLGVLGVLAGGTMFATCQTRVRDAIMSTARTTFVTVLIPGVAASFCQSLGIDGSCGPSAPTSGGGFPGF
ncbi:MAG: hypothetical protein ACE5EX_08325 [Phycisphaerae bacterium]